MQPNKTFTKFTKLFILQFLRIKKLLQSGKTLIFQEENSTKLVCQPNQKLIFLNNAINKIKKTKNAKKQNIKQRD